MIDLLKRNGADLLNLFVVPIIIALMPRRIGFPLLKMLARFDRSHSVVVEQAWQAASSHCPGHEAEEWKRRFRLLRLQERVDTWLVLLRSSRWWSSRIEQRGDWPAPGQPYVFLTYHWGGGQWIWRQLHKHGIQAHFLAKRAEAVDLGAGRVALWYGRFRKRGVTQPGNREIIFTGRSTGLIRATLDKGRSVVGMMDVPATAGQAILQRPLLDGEIRFPFGLARLASEAEVPVVLFSCAFDIESGRRTLEILTLPAGITVESIATSYVEQLDRCLKSESAFWQLWPAAPLLFVQYKPPAVQESRPVQAQ